jgi:O-antigen ligase
MYIFVTALCLKDQYHEKSSRLIFAFIILISLISLILGASRMALFSFPVIFIIYLVFSKKINLKSLIIFCFIISVSILILFSFFSDSILATKLLMGLNDEVRVQIWVSSILSFIENNWLFGIGVGNSIFIDVISYFPNDALSRSIDNPHNLYLDMLLERGALGLFTFAAFLFSILKIKDNNKKFLLYIRILVLTLLLMGLANITFRYEFALLFIILIGSYLNPSVKK